MTIRDPASDLAVRSVGDSLAEAAERIIAGGLPIPVRQRWQPLRLGLLNVFLFEDERFPFADGRLLLRGSNGAGKSRVLAMTLPLLLDGMFTANRTEPDRDPNRQVAWNLLMDDQDSRTGYTWLELGRTWDPATSKGNGSPPRHQYLTIGCGMKAVRGQPIKPWFFITDLRVDESLDLQTADGVPLTQRQLTEALATHGQVVERAQDYRRLLDEQLFRLGDRYEPLIDLLLQLRQPQLAKKLDLEQLEAALRGALPPLPETLLEDAAEAFRDLDQYRAGLAADRLILEGVQKFTRPYRDHVRRGTMRAAKRLTQAQSEFDKTQRQHRQTTDDLQSHRTLLVAEEQRLRELCIELASADAALETLRNRPEMQDAAHLDQLRASIRRQHDELGEMEKDLVRIVGDEKVSAAKIEEAASELTAKHAAAEAAWKNATAAAAPDALGNRHRDLTKPLLVESDASDKAATSVAGQLEAETRRWQKCAFHLAAKNTDLIAAASKLRDAKRDVERAQDQVTRIREELETSAARQSAETDRLWNAIVTWMQFDSPLYEYLPSLKPFSDVWHAWSESLSGFDPLEEAILRAERETEHRFAAEEAALRGQIQEQKACVQQLDEESHKLESGAAMEPPVPYTRDPASRQRLDGAPLWQLVDFVAQVPEGERADWEAALEAAGLLDAWLTSDGKLLNANLRDTQLVVGNEPVLPADRQLRRVLSVDKRCETKGVAGSVVEALLAIIGVGAGAGRVWVDRDGRWQNGPLHGRWTKAQAQYIGEEARARWRTARLAAIAQERLAINADMAKAEKRITEIAQSRQRVVELRQQLPTTTLLFQFHAQFHAKQSELDHASELLRACQFAEREQFERVTQLTRYRDQEAADVGLTNWVQKLEELVRRLSEYEAKLQVFWAKLEQVTVARRRSDEAFQRLREVSTYREVLLMRCDHKKLELAKDEARFRELDATTGQAVAEILKRMEAQRTTKEELEKTTEGRRHQINELGKRIAVLENQLEQLDDLSRRCDEERRGAADWFSTIGNHGMINSAIDNFEIPLQPWSMTQAIKVARNADGRLEDVKVDDDSWQQSQNRVHEAHNALQQTILSQEGMGTDVDHLRDGLQLVTISMQGERMPLAAATARLEAGLAERDRILDEKEQETLEKYLLGEVADGLRRRMKLAADLVESMTREVSQRPMKTGMQMRFRWQRDPEGPPGLAEACDVLQTISATWSPEEREQIKQFLQRRIRVQRDSDLVGSWHDHLRAALDYRAWYRIEISRRSGPEADWRLLTRRTYGSGSGGEKAIALTLPQLAAAAAFYQTADANAPRFILLDEAFAGISHDMRESCLELIAAFDLDVVMTSESEWGCYAGVPQLAICQLDRFAGINAVVNRVYVWNGKQKLAAAPAKVAAPRTRELPVPE